MKVRIKDFGINLDILSRGLEIEVKDNSGKHLGDLFITKTQLIWCKGRTRRENGVPVTWATFQKWMES